MTYSIVLFIFYLSVVRDPTLWTEHLFFHYYKFRVHLDQHQCWWPYHPVHSVGRVQQHHSPPLPWRGSNEYWSCFVRCSCLFLLRENNRCLAVITHYYETYHLIMLMMIRIIFFSLSGWQKERVIRRQQQRWGDIVAGSSFYSRWSHSSPMRKRRSGFVCHTSWHNDDCVKLPLVLRALVSSAYSSK